MVILKHLVTLATAALLAAIAALSGCSVDPASGLTGHLNVQTPFGSIQGDLSVVPPVIRLGGPDAGPATQPAAVDPVAASGGTPTK